MDTAKLTDWLQNNIDGFVGPISLSIFKGGQSNPTYKVSAASGDYVLRSKPKGKLLKGAHAIEREARVISALHGAGFPTPRVYGYCADDDVFGSQFFVMEMVEGRIFWDLTLPDIARDERAAYFDAMNETLAALHAIDFESIGLEDYGKHGGFVERQISLWTRQYLAMEKEAGRNEHLDRLIEWLPNNVPDADEVSIAHGDFRIDNMIFDPVEPKIIAVLDWELSTLGHPLADFAYHIMMYRMPHGLRAGLKGLDLAELGLPSEEEYVRNYCRRAGRDTIENIDFYLAFNFFRFAAICHGIKGRVVQGNAASADAEELVKSLPRLAEVAWEQALVAGA